MASFFTTYSTVMFSWCKNCHVTSSQELLFFHYFSFLTNSEAN